MLVTGSSRGVGAEVARLAAEAGADVVVNYRNKRKRADAVAEAVRGLGRRASVVEADLTDGEAVARMFADARSELGAVDIVVLNASGGLEKDVDAGYAMRLNRDAQVNAAREAISAMPDGGTLVFVTSHLAHFHGEKPVPDVYEVVAVSKRAGESALREMLPEFAAAGIRCVFVSGDLIDGTVTPKLLDRVRPGMIAGRREQVDWLPTATDFAAAIVLAAGDVSLEHGATIYVGDTDWEMDEQV